MVLNTECVISATRGRSIKRKQKIFVLCGAGGQRLLLSCSELPVLEDRVGAHSVTFGIKKLINLRGGDFRCLCSLMFTAVWRWRVDGLYFMNVTLLRREGKEERELESLLSAEFTQRFD